MPKNQYQSNIAEALGNWGKAIMPDKTADEMRAEEQLYGRKLAQEAAVNQMASAGVPASGIVEALKFIRMPQAEQERGYAEYPIAKAMPNYNEVVNTPAEGQVDSSANIPARNTDRGVMVGSQFKFEGKRLGTKEVPEISMTPERVRAVEALSAKPASKAELAGAKKSGGKPTTAEDAYGQTIANLTRTGGKFGSFTAITPSDDNIQVIGEAMQNDMGEKWDANRWMEMKNFIHGKLIAAQNRAQGK